MRSRCGRRPPAPYGSTLTVEPSLVDVLHDPVRNQVPNRFPRVYAFAALGRGDRQGGHLDQAHPATRQARVGKAVAGSGTAYEMRELEKLVRVAPGQHLRERVGSGDEVQVD